MTLTTLKRLMKQHKLTQQAAADLMEVAQPTLHDIVHGRHGLTEKNAQTFRRGLALLAAPNDLDGRVTCALGRGTPMRQATFYRHLPECAGCLDRAWMQGRRGN